jgi:hypothetical protein
MPNVIAHEEFHATILGAGFIEEYHAGLKGNYCGRGPRELW